MDHSAHLTATDGTRLWYGTVGDGPPLVLCDGLACDGFIWSYIIDYFVDDFTLVRWHYRGHGASDVPALSSDVTLEQFCEDLDLLLDEIGADKAILAGHSMGVQIILNFMGYNPDRIGGLVPICGSYKRPLDTFHGSDVMRRALPYLEQLMRVAPDVVQTAWETLLPRQFWYRFAVQAAEVNGRLLRREDFIPYLEHAAEMDLDFFLALLSELSNHSTEDLLPGIDVPTLVIAGEKDTFTPLFRSTEMSELIPNSQLVVVPGGTHVAPLEIPDLVTGAMAKFFDEHHLQRLPALP